MNKSTIISTIAIAFMLAAAFFWSGAQRTSIQPSPTPTVNVACTNTEQPVPNLTPIESTEAPPITELPTVVPSTKPVPSQTTVPTAKPVQLQANVPPSPTPTPTAADAENICTLSVNCDILIGKTGEKADLVPQDGVILTPTTAKFNPGENVFNLLQRELKRAKIHLEFVGTPMYNSVYVEGINNIYEFDYGELSGWVYKVNGEFPNYGSSRYIIKPGDVIEWIYTLDLGRDGKRLNT